MIYISSWPIHVFLINEEKNNIDQEVFRLGYIILDYFIYKYLSYQVSR